MTNCRDLGAMRVRDPIPQLKRELAAQLVQAMAPYRTTDILAQVRIDQPRLSDLRRGRLERMSAERLIRWLSEMGCRVEVRVIRSD